MRRILVLFALIGFVGAGTAVVGGPNASDGEMVIMDSGGSASASAAVGPNGTQWRSSLENLNSSCRSPEDDQNVEFVGFQGDGNMTQLQFTGRINTSNPCTELSMDVKQVNESFYRAEIVKNPSREICTQCTGTAEFSASFSTEGDYRFEVVSDGRTLGVQETPGYGEGKSPEGEKESVLKQLLNWFNSIF